MGFDLNGIIRDLGLVPTLIGAGIIGLIIYSILGGKGGGGKSSGGGSSSSSSTPPSTPPSDSGNSTTGTGA